MSLFGKRGKRDILCEVLVGLVRCVIWVVID